MCFNPWEIFPRPKQSVRARPHADLVDVLPARIGSSTQDKDNVGCQASLSTPSLELHLARDNVNNLRYKPLEERSLQLMDMRYGILPHVHQLR
jgi:hypothetical protein